MVLASYTKFINRSTPTATGLVKTENVIVNLMEVLQSVVLERDDFQNQGFYLPYVLKTWSDSEDYTTYKTTFFQKNVDEILFWCLKSTQKNITQFLMGFF